MSNDRMLMLLYPPVEPPNFPPTWADIEGLALHYPQVHRAVTFYRRGECSQEQALMLAVFELAAAFQQMYAARLADLENRPAGPFMIDFTRKE